MSFATRGLLASFLAVVLLAVSYAYTPTFAFGFSGAFLIVAFVTLGGAAVLFHEKDSRPSLALAMTFVLYVLFSIASTFHIGRSESFRDLIGKREVGTFTQDVAPIDPSQIRIVDQDMARRIGEKLMGEEQALGSRARLGTMNIQHVNGKLYWVGPIVHSGFFAWNKFSDGTPGYVMVSATNPNDFKFVREIDGKPVYVKYQPEAWFGTDLERHLWLNGFMTKGMTDFTFEIDDQGRPYYVVTLYDLKIGFTGEDATGVAVVDVQTGEIKEYAIDQAPAWIDRIQPDDFVKEQLKLWGEYQNGWWNPSGDMKLKPAHDPLFVHGTDGRGYWYTGISSKGKEGAITGFAMIDSRTKEFKYYAISGTVETSAQESVLGKVREKRYEASYPVLYNVAGHPTYVMALKDGAGLVKMVGMADVGNHSIVGVGETVKDALHNYLSARNSNGNATVPDAKVAITKVTGKVELVGADVRGGNSITYFTVSGQSGKAFVADSEVSQEVVLTREGHLVELEYASSSETGFIHVSSFRNRTLGIKMGPTQAAKTAEVEEMRNENARKEDAREADSKWDKLKAADKAKMLEQLKK